MLKSSLVISIHSYQIPREQDVVEGRKPSLWFEVFLAQGLVIKKQAQHIFCQDERGNPSDCTGMGDPGIELKVFSCILKAKQFRTGRFCVSSTGLLHDC